MLNIKKSLLAGVLCCSALSSALVAETVTYNDMFISYFSPPNVETLKSYVNKEGLQGYMLWTVQGDTNPASDPSTSIIRTLNPEKQEKNILGYWEDWSIYNTSRAAPIQPYPITGALNPLTQGNDTATNEDLDAKLGYMNQLDYAFLEAQPASSGETAGTVYFNDPWSDLGNAGTDTFCQNHSAICDFKSSEGKYGNFYAFADLPQRFPNLKTTISIGGYGHDSTFESLFDGSNRAVIPTGNFVTSALEIMGHFNISGIDLDYENTLMTHEQSEAFGKVIEELSSKLEHTYPNKFITVTILGNPNYILGNKTYNDQLIGFAPGVLQEIADLPNVRSINLMTYDFHGAFDYNAADPAQSVTGFLSNVYMPASEGEQAHPQDYDPMFSVKKAVDALESAGVASDKIVVGIPTYGRSIQNIAKNGSTAGYGLYSPIVPGSNSIPRGNLDNTNCDTALPFADNPCTGTFTYAYIVNHMLNNGLTAKTWHDNLGRSNGTTAYGSSYSISLPTFKVTSSILNGFDFGVTVTSNDGKVEYTADNWLSPGKSVYIPMMDFAGKYIKVTLTSWSLPHTCGNTQNNGKGFYVDPNTTDNNFQLVYTNSSPPVCVWKTVS